MQDNENYRLKQQISNLAYDKTHMQQHYVELEKKHKEQEFVIGQDENNEIPLSPANAQ